ncbi:MAG: hypothetical protein FD126_3383 [Elusimicrobia bacterium]|nr:MAG: hypothetical protein FD126_3383 [Elusimicrobiota bacterium]
MRPLPLLGALLLSLPASARERGDGPSKEPKKEPTPIERACREKKIRITLADAPPAEPGAEPGPEAPAPKPSLKEEAEQAAGELGGGKVRYWTDDQGQRTLRWSRGKKSPEQCVDALNALAARMPGRLLVTDPRYGRSRELIKVGADVASAEVAKVEKALPKAEIANSPGFLESFFTGGRMSSPAGPVLSPGVLGRRGPPRRAEPHLAHRHELPRHLQPRQRRPAPAGRPPELGALVYPHGPLGRPHPRPDLDGHILLRRHGGDRR